MEPAAAAIGQKLLVVKASVESELETAFAELMKQRVGALCVEADQFFVHNPPTSDHSTHQGQVQRLAQRRASAVSRLA